MVIKNSIKALKHWIFMTNVEFKKSWTVWRLET